MGDPDTKISVSTPDADYKEIVAIMGEELGSKKRTIDDLQSKITELDLKLVAPCVHCVRFRQMERECPSENIARGLIFSIFVNIALLIVVITRL